jgi:hypothetical protein
MIPSHNLKILKILHKDSRGRHPFKETSDKYHKMTGVRYSPQQIALAFKKANN